MPPKKPTAGENMPPKKPTTGEKMPPKKPTKGDNMPSKKPTKGDSMPPKKRTTGDISDDEDGNCKNSKVYWTDEEFNKFVEICIRGTNEGHRMGNGWGYTGWSWVINQMETKGIKKTQAQLKHKWDWMIKQWRIWQKFIGQETGLGWDREKGTIAASDEWWEEKINAANSKDKNIIYKLRHRGIGEDLYLNYCALFMDKITTGYHRRGPSSMNPTNKAIVIVNDTDEVPCEEGRGDSKEENFESQLNEIIYESTNVPIETDAKSITEGTSPSQGSGRKQKRSENANSYTTGSKKQKKGKKHLPDMLDGWDQLRTDMRKCMEGRLDLLKHTLGDKPGCSIKEVMDDIRNLPGIAECRDLHIFAGHIMTDKNKREMYVAYEAPELKLAYLRMEFQFMSKTDIFK